MLLISTTRGHCRNVISIYYKGALQKLQGGTAGMLSSTRGAAGMLPASTTKVTTGRYCSNVIKRSCRNVIKIQLLLNIGAMPKQRMSVH